MRMVRARRYPLLRRVWEVDLRRFGLQGEIGNRCYPARIGVELMVCFQSAQQSGIVSSSHVTVPMTLPAGFVFPGSANIEPFIFAQAVEVAGASGASLSCTITGVVVAGNAFTVDVRNNGGLTSDAFVINVLVLNTQGGQYVGI